MVTRGVVAVMSVAVLCLAGCTPTPIETPSPTPSVTTPAVTPSPSETAPSWTFEQQAAMDAVAKWFTIYNEVLQGERGPGDFVLAGRGEVVSDAGLTYNQFGSAET